MKLVIPIANQHSYRSIPRNQDLKLKITNRCNWPSRTVSLNFVLQQANWHDLENFVNLSKQFGYWANITRLEDWSTWAGFEDQDVIGNPEHSDHLLAVQELCRVSALYPTAGWGAGLPIAT